MSVATSTAIALGVGAAGTIAGAALSKPNAAQNQATKTLTAAQQAGTAFGQQLQPLALRDINKSSSAYDTASNILAPLAAGNRTAMTSILAPEIKQISSGYDTTLANEREFTPRSGTSTAAAASLPFSKMSSISDLFSGARLGAIQQLPGIAAGYGALGAGTGSAAASAFSGATNAADASVIQQLNQRQQQMNAGAAVGGSLYQIIKSLNLGGGGGFNAQGGVGSAPYGPYFGM